MVTFTVAFLMYVLKRKGEREASEREGEVRG
jgi:hypothetical protein